MKLYDIIEYINEENLLVYKHPCEDFNTNTKLIVRESQKAIFVKNGVICDVFSAGRHNLKTENIPLLKKIINIATSGETSFTAEVYFFDMADMFNIKWGTAIPMEIQDPIYKIAVKLGASGEMTFAITNPENLLKKISGTKAKVDKDGLKQYFRSLIATYIKVSISNAIIKEKTPILELNSKLIDISHSTNEFLNQRLVEYGLIAKNLTIENVVIPEDDPSLNKLKQALSEKAEMDIVGYSYNERRSFDVMQDVAKNKGSGELASSLMGLGVGMGVSKGISDNMSNLNRNVNTQPAQKIFCSKCGNGCEVDALFCSKCGNALNRPELKICSNCGNQVAKDSLFCSKCGKEIK